LAKYICRVEKKISPSKISGWQRPGGNTQIPSRHRTTIAYTMGPTS
jgi:hypothetical protein